MARDEMYNAVVRVNTTTGSGNNTSAEGLYGLLAGVYLDFHASADAGTVTAIAMVTPQGVTITLLTLTNVNTDGFYHIVKEGVGATGTGIGQYFYYPFTGCKLKVTVTLEGGTHTDAVTCTAFFI